MNTIIIIWESKLLISISYEEFINLQDYRGYWLEKVMSNRLKMLIGLCIFSRKFNKLRNERIQLRKQVLLCKYLILYVCIM